MRRIAIISFAAAALLAAVAAAQPAAAFGWERYDGYGDPYFYRPQYRGWYPYYNSGQWRTAREMRYRKRMARQHFYYPQYNPVWGHPLGYDSRAWRPHTRRDHWRHW